MPGIASISAGKDLACIGSYVDTAGIERIRAHTVAQHAQAHTRTRGQTLGHSLPLLAAVFCAIDAELLTDVVAGGIFHDDENGIRIMSIKGDGEAEIGGQIVLDIYPIIAGIDALVNATVVLLVEYIRLCRMLNHAMKTLPKLRVFVRHEVRAHVFVEKDPALTAIICAHTADG